MSRPPHLLHLFSTFAEGGPQVRTASLINAFGASYRHSIVALDSHLECRARLDATIDVAFPQAPQKSRGIAGPLRMARLVRAVRPDAVLTYNWGAIEAVLGARLAGVRRILHAEDGFQVDESGGEKARRTWARRLVLRFASRVVVPSLRLEQIALESWKLPRDKVVLVHNGIDTKRFHPGREPALRAELGIPEDAFVIGTVARLRPEKGLELLIDAFLLLPAGVRDRCRLLIVGDGVELERLRAHARAQEGARDPGVASRVRFTGDLPDTAATFRAMDLFALTSHTEQMPLSVVEAMASGLAIVATDVGDVRAMVAPSNHRWLATDRDPARFASFLHQAFKDEAHRRLVAEEHRRRSLDKYPLERMVEQYSLLYQELLGMDGDARKSETL